MLFVFLAAQVSAGSAGRALDQRVGSIEIRELPIEEALRRLIGDRGWTIVVGFEEIARPASGAFDAPRITLRLEQGTVRDVLTGICSQDPRYVFTEEEEGVINVRPAVEAAEAQAILGMRLSRVDIDVLDWPFNLPARAREFAPELEAYLQMRAADYRVRTSAQLAGAPGGNMRTDVAPPRIEIHLRETTVRGMLNAIAAYTLTHPMSDKARNIVVEPTGWEFRFEFDPNATTGLGGHPRWRPFP